MSEVYLLEAIAVLIPTIEFEIADFKNGIQEEHVVAFTEENLEKINTHRFTRGIRFTKTFDFEFNRKATVPFFFIEPITWARLYAIRPELFDAAVAEEEKAFDEYMTNAN